MHTVIGFLHNIIIMLMVEFNKVNNWSSLCTVRMSFFRSKFLLTTCLWIVEKPCGVIVTGTPGDRQEEGGGGEAAQRGGNGGYPAT